MFVKANEILILLYLKTDKSSQIEQCNKISTNNKENIK